MTGFTPVQKLKGDARHAALAISMLSPRGDNVSSGGRYLFPKQESVFYNNPPEMSHRRDGRCQKSPTGNHTTKCHSLVSQANRVIVISLSKRPSE